MQKRLKMTIGGRVQGVGFRHFVKKHAQELKIRGYVKNRADGKVEVVAEGEEKMIRVLITCCKKGPLLAKVENIELQEEKVRNENSEFRTKYE